MFKSVIEPGADMYLAKPVQFEQVARIDLSENDLSLLECFLQAHGDVVSRETLRGCLRRASDGDASDGLTATIYRLRRRIERATPNMVPLQSKSRVGHVFKAT